MSWRSFIPPVLVAVTVACATSRPAALTSAKPGSVERDARCLELAARSEWFTRIGHDRNAVTFIARDPGRGGFVETYVRPDSSGVERLLFYVRRGGYPSSPQTPDELTTATRLATRCPGTIALAEPLEP